MKKSISLLLITILMAMIAVPAFGHEEISEDSVVLTEDIFTLAEAAVEEAEESGAEYEGFIFRVEDPDVIDSERLDSIEEIDSDEGLFTAGSLEEIAEAVPEELIEYIEPDYIMELFSADEPNDEYYSSGQWNITDLNVPGLWKAGIEGQDLDLNADMDNDGDPGNDRIVVAVIDSGLNIHHEDIDSTRIVGEWNFVENSSDVTDEVGHGTFVAGEIMANKDNAVGIAGIGQGIEIMPLKVFDSTTTSTSSVISAIRYVTELKNEFDSSGGGSGLNVCVINISFGGNNGTESLKNAVEAAIDSGIIVVCAAGNNGSSASIYPAMYAIGVGAYDQSGSVASFSQRLSEDNGEGYENKVWVSAPGVSIRSTFKNNSSYDVKSGSSFACPEVSALAAICKGLDNSLTHYEFRQLLKETAIYSDSGLGSIGGQDTGFGWGKVDYIRAAEKVLGYQLNKFRTDGWFKNSYGNWYYFRNRRIMTGWQKINGTWYYLKESGIMATGWQKINGTWYYLKESGAMATGWQKINGTWYYLKGSGAMATGWQKINGTWYYLKTSGAMATGWQKINGTWYYLKTSGAMAANEWVPGHWWVGSSGAWTYTYKGSWHKNSTGWWYGDESGWYARNETIIIDDVSYTFDSRGYLK